MYMISVITIVLTEQNRNFINLFNIVKPHTTNNI